MSRAHNWADTDVALLRKITDNTKEIADGGGGGSLPSQAGQGGKFLTTNGSAASWGTPAGAGDMLKADNLSGLANTATARTNLGVAIGTNVAGISGNNSFVGDNDFPNLKIGTGSRTHLLHIFSTTNDSVGIDSTGTDSNSMLHIKNVSAQGPFFDFWSAGGRWAFGNSQGGAFVLRNSGVGTDPVNGTSLWSIVSTGVVTQPGSVISAPATITLTTNAGTLVTANHYSAVTITANSTITPDAAGTSGQTCLVKVTNSDGTNSKTLTIDNSGTDYTVTVPASSFRWIAYVSNGTDWIPTGLDAASGSSASTSRVYLQNPTSGMDFYDTAANLVSAGFPSAIPNGTTATTQAANSADTKVATDAYVDTAAGIGFVGTFASPDTTAGALTLTHKTTVVYTSAAGATRTYQLPAAASFAGYSVQLVVVAGTNHVNFQPASGAQLNLEGTLLTADHYAQDTTSAAKDKILAVCDGTNWNLGYEAAPVGTWADSASA